MLRDVPHDRRDRHHAMVIVGELDIQMPATSKENDWPTHVMSLQVAALPRDVADLQMWRGEVTWSISIGALIVALQIQPCSPS